jgi:hypothetical protein
MCKAGADEVIIDTGSIAGEVQERLPGGADKVLELIGTATRKRFHAPREAGWNRMHWDLGKPMVL